MRQKKEVSIPHWFDSTFVEDTPAYWRNKMDEQVGLNSAALTVARVQAAKAVQAACASIAIAPFTGTPHTQYSEGKMDAANIIARDIERLDVEDLVRLLAAREGGGE